MMIITETDANGIKRNPIEYNFVLVYKDLEIVVLQFNDNTITGTTQNLEVFETAQEMADRCVELDLNIQIHHMISALEYGVELTEPRKTYFWDNVWTVGTEEEKHKLIELGYSEV